MIIGIGTDQVYMRRIDRLYQRFGDRFLTRILTVNERAICQAKYRHRKGGVIAAYSRRWAAKEACAKALKTGIGAVVGWRDIEVQSAISGEPRLSLSAKAQQYLQSLLPSGHRAHIHLSLSDELDQAQAFVVISAEKA